jgi:hypothetical protein
MAASAAALAEFEYLAFDDDCNGDIISEFVADVEALPPSNRTVRLVLPIRFAA